MLSVLFFHGVLTVKPYETIKEDPIEKGQKDKQRTTKHETTKDRVTQPSLKPGMNLGAPDGCAVPASKLLQSTLL
jgi:hypothetical protein